MNILELFIDPLTIFKATLWLWLAFIVLANNIDNSKSTEDQNKILKFLGVGFVIGDVCFNYTYGAALFLEWADNDRKTLTARLKEILTRDDSSVFDKYWRKPVARFMCLYMIEPWDTGHCKLGKQQVKKSRAFVISAATFAIIYQVLT